MDPHRSWMGRHSQDAGGQASRRGLQQRHKVGGGAPPQAGILRRGSKLDKSRVALSLSFGFGNRSQRTARAPAAARGPRARATLDDMQRGLTFEARSASPGRET